MYHIEKLFMSEDSKVRDNVRIFGICGDFDAFGSAGWFDWVLVDAVQSQQDLQGV